jgi:hypothetical protein
VGAGAWFFSLVFYIRRVAVFGVLAAWGSLVFLLHALPRLLGWLYFLFSLTPVRGGTYFFC